MFKQKTAYEMRISDWSSDVCSSDLRLVERFVTRYPAVTVRIVPAFSGYLLDLLQRGEVDIAVMYETPGARQIRVEPLIVEELFLVGARGSDLAMRAPVPFARLADLAMILPGPRQGLRRLLEGEARTAGKIGRAHV